MALSSPAALLALLLAAAAPVRASADELPSLVLHAAHLFDGVEGRANVWVVVAGGKIERVATSAPPAGAARVVELGDATILPGLIDTHVHLLIPITYDFARGRLTMLSESSAAKALRGLRAAEDLLHAGFTTIRVPGDFDLYRAHLDVRDAIDAGEHIGPHIYAADRFITRTGGNYDSSWAAADQDVRPWARVADGPDALVRAVREEVRAGADWVKIAASGGNSTPGSMPALATFTEEEMSAAVGEAHRLGRKVAVHAHSAAGVESALRAGVDSIEHGSLATPEQLREMARRHVFWVPTWYANPAGLERGAWLSAWRSSRDAVEERQQMKVALAAGTPIAFGTESGLYPHGQNARMLTILVECGMKPIEALRTATSSAAKMLGLPKTGRVAAGLEADLVVVRGNALADVAATESVRLVVLGGRIVREER